MITKDMYIEDLVRTYPGFVRPLADEGLVCIACGEPVWGTLESLAQEKGITDLEEIIGKFNAIIQNDSGGQ